MKSIVSILFYLTVSLSVLGQAPSITTYPYTQPTSGNKVLSWNTSQYESWVYTRYNQWGAAQKLPFRLLKPVGYDNTTKLYPLIIMFHGKGEAGTDNNYHLIHGGEKHKNAVNNAVNPPGVNNSGMVEQRKFEGFVVFPQEPEGSWTWSPNFDPSNPTANVTTALSQALELVDSLKIKYRIDPDKIIVHGLSSGGTATWYCLYLRPDLFAAALPMSAPATSINMPTMMSKLAPIPIWLSQGGKDDNPIPYISQQEMKALRDSGAIDPTITKYSEYPTRSHDCWNDTYDDLDFFPYMLRQNKGKISVLGNNPVCANTTVVLSLSPGFYQYEWYYNNNLIPGETSNKLRNVSQPGNYYARFKRSNMPGQVFATSNTVTISSAAVVPKPSISADNSLILPSPSNYSVNLSGPAGATQYEWSNGATTASINVSSSGDYRVRVKQSGGYCWSAFSDTAKVRTTQGSPVPAEATSLSATALSSSSIQFTWQDNATTETGYEIYRAVYPNQAWDFKYIARVGANNTSYIDNSVSASTLYSYKVRAVNNVAATYSSTYAEATTPAASVNYYSRSSGNLETASTWGTSSNGSGTAPTNFTSPNQIFNIANRATTTLANPWTVSGSFSKINVASGVILTVSNTLTGNVSLLSGSSVKFTTPSLPTFTYIDNASTLEITNSSSLNNTSYGHLKLTTGGTKTFTTDTVDITGDLTLANGITLQGKPTVLRLAGDLIFSDTLPIMQNISIYLKKPSQQIDAKGGTIQLNEFKTAANSAVTLLNGSKLRLGSSAGGGLTLGKNASLNIGAGSIYILNGGSLNADSTSNGTIASTQGSIYLNSYTTKNSYLKPSTTNKTFKNITNNNTGNKSLVLLDSVLLTNTLKLSQGTFKTNGKLVLVSNLSGTARIAKVESGASLVGNVTWQRWIGPNRVQSISYLATPIKNKRVADLSKFISIKGFLPSESSTFSTWNEATNKWVGVRDSNMIMAPGTGYRTTIKTQDIKYASNSAFYQFAGSPVVGDGAGNNTGSFVIPITKQSGSFNLVGNPYPSEIDWDATGWDKTNIDNSYYVWDGVLKGYKVYKGAAGGSSAVGTLGMTSIINSGQAFLVKATSAGSSTLSLNENVKTTQSVLPSFFRMGSVDPLIRVMLQDQDSTHIDEAIVRFYENATLSYDAEYDATKYPGAVLNISSVVGNDKLTVNSLPYSSNNVTVPLNVQAYNGGKYKINFLELESLPSQTQAYLYDRLHDSTVNLKTNSSYTFTQSTAFDETQRFEIRFMALPTNQVLAYEQAENFVQKLAIYPNPSDGNTTFEINLKNESNLELKVYNMEGMLVYQNESFGHSGSNKIHWNIDQHHSKTGLYLYVLDTDEKKYSGKVVIK